MCGGANPCGMQVSPPMQWLLVSAPHPGSGGASVERRLPEKGMGCHWWRGPKDTPVPTGGSRWNRAWGGEARWSLRRAHGSPKGEPALVWPEPPAQWWEVGAQGQGGRGSQPHSTPSSLPLGQALAVEPVTGAGSGWKECSGAPTQRLRRGEQSSESQAFDLPLAEKRPAAKNLPSTAAQTPPTSTERKGVRVQAASPHMVWTLGTWVGQSPWEPGCSRRSPRLPRAASCLHQSRRTAPSLFLCFGWCKRIGYKTLLKAVQPVGLLPESKGSCRSCHLLPSEEFAL